MEMDFLEMKFEDGDFDLVIDKGSFDALCCDTTNETWLKVVKYLSECMRVTKVGGKYLCVSLL